MKQIIVIILLLLSINVFSQQDSTRNKIYLGIEAYRGYNNMSDFFKDITGKSINRNNLYLQNGYGIKIYDFFYSDFFAENKYPFKLNSGFTLFNIGKGNIVSIPLNFKIDIKLPKRIFLSAYLGGRYFTNANKDFNNKVILEYGFEIKYWHLITQYISFGWSTIGKSNFIHLDIPLISLTK